MTTNTSTLKQPWLARFSDRLQSATYRLLRNVKLQLRPDELLVRGSTDSYQTVQIAIAAIKKLIISEKVMQRVRLVLRVNGWPLEIVMSKHVTHSWRCEQTLTP